MKHVPIWRLSVGGAPLWPGVVKCCKITSTFEWVMRCTQVGVLNRKTSLSGVYSLLVQGVPQWPSG